MRTIIYKGKTYKVFTYSSEFGNQEVILVEEEYSAGGLAITMMCVDDGVVTEPYSTLTVCLGSMDKSDNAAFVDTNNNSEAESFIKKNRLGKDTGRQASSGYCVYPLYLFDTAKFYA